MTPVEVAETQVGVREAGHNRGQRVEEYQADNGGSPGEPWCADFVCFCLRRADPPVTFVASRSALGLWRKNPDAQRDEPAPGRVFVMDHGAGLGHVGFVKDVTAGGIVTVEGNTSELGSREGDGVYERVRGLGGQIIGYLDFTPGAVPAEVMGETS